MTPQFTLGIEEEFQMVDKTTGHLVSRIHHILEKGKFFPEDRIKAEMLQSVVEIITDVCPNIPALRQDLQEKRAQLTKLVDEEGLALVSAGTHPQAHWKDQARTQSVRYEALEEEYQDVGRSIMICGLHIHVGLADHELAVPVMNQLRTWIPHLLALSSNSPFWINRNTGLKSYRTIVWKRFPRTGIPPLFPSTGALDQYIHQLIQTGCIDNAKRIWWDIRPHPYFPTIEFRICDMPATFEDSIALAALSQALVAKLVKLSEQNLSTNIYDTLLIEENKWRAARYGLDAEIVDFTKNRTIPMRTALAQLFDFVDDVLDDLNTRPEINYLRQLIEHPGGTGADRQIAIYNDTHSTDAVVRYLIQQTSLNEILLLPQQ